MDLAFVTGWRIFIDEYGLQNCIKNHKYSNEGYPAEKPDLNRRTIRYTP